MLGVKKRKRFWLPPHKDIFLLVILREGTGSRYTHDQKILLAKIGFDTAENEPSKVRYKSVIRHKYKPWIPHLQPRPRRDSRRICLILLEGEVKCQKVGAYTPHASRC